MNVATLAARLGLKVDKGAWAEGTKRIGTMQVALGVLVAHGIRRAFDAFKDLTFGMAAYGDALQDASRKSGVSTAFLEELAFSAGGTKENLDKVTGAATKMSVQLAEAVANKSSDAAKALKELGLSLDDPRVKLGDVEGVMRVMADRFEGMADGSQKNRLAMALMDRSGADLSQVLSELREKTEAFKKAGGPTEQSDLDALNKAKDFTEALAQGWHNVKVKAAAFALPRIQEAIQGVSKWYEEHRETITAVYAVVRKTIVTVVTELYERWVEVFGAIKEFVKDNKESLLTFFKAVGTVGYIAFRAVLATVKFLITAFGVLTVAVVTVIDWFVKIGEWLGETTAKVVLFFAKASELGTTVAGVFVSLGEGVKKVWEKIIGWIEEKVGWVVGKAEWVADKLGLGSDSGIAPQDAFLQGFRSTQTQNPQSAFLQGFSSTSRPPQNSNAGQTINGAPVTVNVTAGPGMDANALAQLIAAKTRDVLDSQLRIAAETLITVGG